MKGSPILVYVCLFNKFLSPRTVIPQSIAKKKNAINMMARVLFSLLGLFSSQQHSNFLPSDLVSSSAGIGVFFSGVKFGRVLNLTVSHSNVEIV
jgi:hypothetical protein